MSGSGGPSDPSQNLSVVPDDVQAIGQYVYNIADTMKQALDSAAREVDNLLAQGWTGDAAAEFSTGWTETHDGGTQLLQALTSLAEKLGVTAATYRNTDTAISTGISSLDLP
ncbi:MULTISPECIES: WXG100 family type VII secretion target [unclassified Nocardia]|uniref:WXG100 family type VII secretion target n=1 Tax=unclassified Nocardia TaxID=2637762 RepID=UPI001CE3C512|nr:MULTISPECIES: WXG100 family type VII secretion target [unclassified Nocardia]